MTRKKNKPQNFFRMEPELAKKLDQRIARMGYLSRSDFFAAVAYATIRESESKKESRIPQETADWLNTAVPALTEDEIRKNLLKIIGETLTPVIAIRGVDIAFPATWKDVRLAMHEQTGIWTTESELKEAYSAFAALNKTALAEYKNAQLTPEDTE